MSDSAIRATVHGQVQGVGYRYAVVERARALGVLGWVRNDDDGTVQVHAEGAADAVVELATFLHQGPPGAAVESVDAAEVKVEGHEQFAIRGVPAGRFVVEIVDAGCVLRLEVDGAWRSWSMKREPSMVPADKRFAAPLDGDGVAPPDTPGAAPTWDGGTYEQGGRVAWPEAIERGHAVFVLHGEQLRGGFALQRIRGTQWLLIKRRDAFAR